MTPYSSDAWAPTLQSSIFDFDLLSGLPPRRSLWQRVLFLCLTASAGIGGQYAYNLIGAVAPVLHKAPFEMGGAQVGLLFCAYSLPNTIMPLFGGLINDRLGVRVASVLFSVIVVLGSAVCWLAVSLSRMDSDQRFLVLMLGMALFGIGSESLCVSRPCSSASHCVSWVE